MFAGKTLSMLYYSAFALAREDEAVQQCSPSNSHEDESVSAAIAGALPVYRALHLVKPAIDTRSGSGVIGCHNGVRVPGVEEVESLDCVRVEVRDVETLPPWHTKANILPAWQGR